MAEASDFLPVPKFRRAPDVSATPDEAFAGKRRHENRKLLLLYAVFGVQALSAFFFLGELWSEILGLRSTPIPYAYQELIQIFASLGLVIGVLASALLVRGRLNRMEELNRQMDIATGNYASHLRDQFCRWQLSPSEEAVTIYAMKGFSNAEIAEFRSTTAATVKSQMNAVYRKSGLSNRQQLISFLVEELLEGVLPSEAAAVAKQSRQQRVA